MNERFMERTKDAKVAHDMGVVADFIRIWCDGHHDDRDRSVAMTEGAELGVYGMKVPVLCEECASHLAYAEKRRAYCPKDPKPFCAHCDVHCYKSDERAWQQEMMRYSGKKAWHEGHAIDGIRHMLEGIKARHQMKAT